MLAAQRLGDHADRQALQLRQNVAPEVHAIQRPSSRHATTALRCWEAVGGSAPLSFRRRRRIMASCAHGLDLGWPCGLEIGAAGRRSSRLGEALIAVTRLRTVSLAPQLRQALAAVLIGTDRAAFGATGARDRPQAYRDPGAIERGLRPDRRRDAEPAFRKAGDVPRNVLGIGSDELRPRSHGRRSSCARMMRGGTPLRAFRQSPWPKRFACGEVEHEGIDVRPLRVSTSSSV